MKLKGEIELKASKGKILPLIIVPRKELVRITEKKYEKINYDKLPYSMKNLLKRAIKDKDVYLKQSKESKK